jgi:carbon storage regulator CsrA
MLIVRRRAGQRLVVAGTVQITVAEVARGSVRLEVVAPQGVSVMRGEVFERIHTANKEAHLRVETSRFGPVDVPAGWVFKFPQGLVGFAQETELLLVDRGRQVAWLQSAKTPGFALPVLEASQVGAGYPQPGVHALAKEVGFSGERLLLLVVAHLEAESLCVNLLAPILLDLDARCGIQLALDPKRYTTSHALGARTRG